MTTTKFTKGSKVTKSLVGICGLFAAFVYFVVEVPVNVAAQSVPTFNKDVAPILYANCVTCHRPDGIGPFPLIQYEDAQLAAESIKDMVSSRQMPPWYADRRFGEFKN